MQGLEKGAEPFRKFGLDSEQRIIKPNSFSGDHFPWLCHRLGTEKYFPPRGKYENMIKVQAAVKKVQTNLSVTVWAAMSTLGFLAASIPAVQWVGLHARDHQQAI